MKPTNIAIVLLVLLMGISIPVSYAEIIHDNASKINNLVVDREDVYFFEIDNSKQSSTWMPDTNVYAHDDSGVRLVSDIHFIFPMELTEHGNYLYFSKLEDSCIGNVICDYQDVVRMSKTDGSFDVIIDHLKSAIRLSVENNGIYISESNGNIWKFNHDGTSPQLLYETNNIIIMDIMTEKDGTIYWIEEIEDQNNSILKMEPNSDPVTIASELEIPYDLKDDYGQFWNEIYTDMNKGLSERTKITQHTDSVDTVVGDFKNTNPLSHKQAGNHYGPYLIVGDYLLFSNNTDNGSAIQMQNTITEQSYDIQTVDYKVEFMRAEGDYLYVIGAHQDRFLIEKITLPVSVPEFSVLTITVLATGMFLAIAGFGRFAIMNSSYR
ncbi:MAG: hypothetical protein GWN01_03630 [Nitrosopumilaceae archaeon]|nr:hypothetical protein [Nitrosopumilaceae archaeon]NIU00049.1 hypothetical protein [Nitrosopumilaceae archaeon]NIU86428.1 hypothetical protein [Nitrosopumilaceae archaeon]NIV65137.1 hypothetical protein [Nitrosopumilaceae archaeon]NIX60651.1 hypothetical protein [Nitrosopumilaceae archaeon]